MRPMSPTSMRTRYHKAAPPFAQRKVRWARPTCLILVVSLLLDGEPSARAGDHSCDSWQAAQGNQVPQKEHASVALCIAVPCIISQKCECILKFASIECHKLAVAQSTTGAGLHRGQTSRMSPCNGFDRGRIPPWHRRCL